VSGNIAVNLQQLISVRVKVVFFVVLGKRLPSCHFVKVETSFCFWGALVYLVGGFGKFRLELFLWGFVVLVVVKG